MFHLQARANSCMMTLTSWFLALARHSSLSW